MTKRNLHTLLLVYVVSVVIPWEFYVGFSVFSHNIPHPWIWHHLLLLWMQRWLSPDGSSQDTEIPMRSIRVVQINLSFFLNSSHPKFNIICCFSGEGAVWCARPHLDLTLNRNKGMKSAAGCMKNVPTDWSFLLQFITPWNLTSFVVVLGLMMTWCRRASPDLENEPSSWSESIFEETAKVRVVPSLSKVVAMNSQQSKRLTKLKFDFRHI